MPEMNSEADPGRDATQKRSVFGRAWQWLKRGTTATDWLIVLLTAVIAGTTALQWYELHEGASDTHSLAVAAKAQADAARAIAEQTAKQAGATQRMANAFERARLTIGVGCDPIVSLAANPSIVGKTWKAYASLENMNGEVVRNITVHVAAELIPRSRTVRFGKERRVLNGGTMTGLNSLRTMPLEFTDIRTGRSIGPITQQLLDDMTAGRVRLFFHGDVLYVDAVGCHRQEFCWLFDVGIGTGGAPTSPSGAWMPYQKHQDETECKGYPQ